MHSTQDIIIDASEIAADHNRVTDSRDLAMTTANAKK